MFAALGPQIVGGIMQCAVKGRRLRPPRSGLPGDPGRRGAAGPMRGGDVVRAGDVGVEDRSPAQATVGLGATERRVVRVLSSRFG